MTDPRVPGHAFGAIGVTTRQTASHQSRSTRRSSAPAAPGPRTRGMSSADAPVLHRCAKDFRTGSFSVYHGTETTGQTRQIGAP
jgi:hypothetical protein